MKTYKTPIIEIVQMQGMTLLSSLISPSGDIQGTPKDGINNPGGKGAPIPYPY